MTATVTELTRSLILSTPYDTLSTTVGVAAIVLLLFLLIQKEFIRAYSGPRSKAWMQASNIAILPLSLAFGLIVARRFVEILP